MDAIADVDEAAFAEGLQQGRKCALEGCSAAALSIAGRRHAEYIGHVGSLQAWGDAGLGGRAAGRVAEGNWNRYLPASLSLSSAHCYSCSCLTLSRSVP